MTRRWGPTVCLIVTTIFWPRVGRPCAPAPPNDARVEIVGEEAVIVWDSRARTQHFIRRAHFTTDAPAFGFLVPSPTIPELAEIPNAVFDELTAAIGPKKVVDRGLRFQPVSILMTPFMFLSGAARSKATWVEVLKEQRVAGYDAVVLAADDPVALAAWLEQHGFAAGPDLEAWLSAYVTKRWKLTAFKIAKDAETEQALKTSAVRMSFRSDEPFYPYREPASQRAAQDQHAPRSLRVFVISDAPLKGLLASQAWPAQVEYRASVPDLRTKLPREIAKFIPATPWLHAFVDRRTPRPGVDDVFFAPDPNATPIEPPPDVIDRRTTVWLPVDLLFVGAAIWWWRRRRRDKSSTTTFADRHP